MTTVSPLTKREVEQDEDHDADDGGDREREGSDGKEDDSDRTLDDIIDAYTDD